VNGSEFQVLAVLNGTAFYVLGICLASMALIVTALGLREKSFPSTAATRIVIVIFALLVVGTTTFAVRYSRNEQTDRRAKIAAEEKEALSTQAAATTGSKSSGGAAAASGPGGTLKLAADPTQLAFDTKSLSSKPGKVTIDFTNPAPIQHDVAIAQGSKVFATSQLISKSNTTVSADLAPGKYVFYCDVPGHRQAGMQGTLTVK
jgi:plastocyanin